MPRISPDDFKLTKPSWRFKYKYIYSKDEVELVDKLDKLQPIDYKVIKRNSIGIAVIMKFKDRQ